MRVQDSGFRVQGSGFRVQGAGFRVQGSGFRVQGPGCGVGSALGVVRVDQILEELPVFQLFDQLQEIAMPALICCVQGCTSLIRNRAPLGPYSRTMPRVIGGS